MFTKENLWQSFDEIKLSYFTNRNNLKLTIS